MAAMSKFEQLVKEVAQAELIPTDRALTAEEIARLDDLAARLRAKFFGDRTEEIRQLLRRVSNLRIGKRPKEIDSPAISTAPAPAAVVASLIPKKKSRQRKKPKTPVRSPQRQETHQHSVTLRRIALAGRPISPSDSATLDALVCELEKLSRTNPRARTLWVQAQETRSYLTGASSDPTRDRSGVPSAGQISAPRGLERARREVSGGLPGTRRAH